MNNLKMYLALIALMIPLLLCAKGKCIDLKKEHCNHRTPAELFIPVEAFIDERNKELTIEFSQEWEPVTIEVISKEGYVVYRDLCMPYANSTFSISLESIPSGVYELTISDESMEVIGEFVYEH